MRPMLLCPSHVANYQTTLNGASGDGIFASYGVLQGKDSTYVDMWFSIANYSTIPYPLPQGQTVLVNIIVTCGDAIATVHIDFPIGIGYNYAEFCCALMDMLEVFPLWKSIFAQIRQKVCILNSDFGLFLLPLNLQGTRLDVLQFLCNEDLGHGQLSKVFFRLPWAGPLGHLPWSAIALDQGTFTLLVVTGSQRVSRWVKSAVYTVFTQGVIEDSKLHNIKALAGIFQYMAVSWLDKGGEPWFPVGVPFARRVYPQQQHFPPNEIYKAAMDALLIILKCRNDVLSKQETLVLHALVEVSLDIYLPFSTDIMPSDTLFNIMYQGLLTRIGSD
jgi:hypothetical protein